MILVGLTALSEDIKITFEILFLIAAIDTDLVDKRLFLKPSILFISTNGTCLYAAA